jgi:hypothetical protein
VPPPTPQRRRCLGEIAAVGIAEKGDLVSCHE